eukprot:6624576-Prymnesium_polylepis.1
MHEQRACGYAGGMEGMGRLRNAAGLPLSAQSRAGPRGPSFRNFQLLSGRRPRSRNVFIRPRDCVARSAVRFGPSPFSPPMLNSPYR